MSEETNQNNISTDQQEKNQPQLNLNNIATDQYVQKQLESNPNNVTTDQQEKNQQQPNPNNITVSSRKSKTIAPSKMLKFLRVNSKTITTAETKADGEQQMKLKDSFNTLQKFKNVSSKIMKQNKIVKL